MKANVFFSSTVAILFSSILFLGGCGGASTPTGGGSEAHGTFVYVQNDSQFDGRKSASGSISGFRMNPDGTLTALPGSPFSIYGNLAVSGNFLLVANNGMVTSYRIDPSSGSLTPAQTAVTSGRHNISNSPENPIVVASNYVYVGASPADGTDVIYGFSIDANGSLAAISGSPFSLDDCGCSLGGMVVQNSMLFASDATMGYSRQVVYNVQGDGALVNMQALHTDIGDMGVYPSGNVAYALNGPIEGFTIGANWMLTHASTTLDDDGFFVALAIDPTGKLLAAIGWTAQAPSSTTNITVFSIDPVTSRLTNLSATVSTGESGGNSITFDPSGKFILVTNGGISPPPDDVMVFSFDPASGTVTKIQSAPTGDSFPGSVMIATF